jgi:hypothetical protein
MKEQVTSIEQSKRLIELGVPAEKASMVWFPEYKIVGNAIRIDPNGNYELIIKRPYIVEDKVVPAFTVADLIAILPTVCGDFQIGLDRVRKDSTHIFYEAPDQEPSIVFFIENSLIESCVTAIEWVLSNNYKLNI